MIDIIRRVTHDAALNRRLRSAAWPATALVLCLLGWFDLTQHYAADAAVALALSCARAAPLLWCRSRPLFAWGISLATVAVTALATTPVSPAETWPWAVTSLACYLAVAGAAAPRLSRLRAAAMSAAFLGVTALLLAAFPNRGSWSSLLVSAVGTALVLAAAEVVRDRDRTRRRLVEQEQISESERTRRALLEERARIGRELHDVVAHHMSLIAVRAETAPYRLPHCDEDARDEFKAINGSAREALTDMRRLLGLLRGDDTSAERAPQPAATDIPLLVEQAGPEVRLELDGDLDGIASTTGLCAYRIVQEALSNARRHAPGSATTVSLHRAPEALRVAVDCAPRLAGPTTAVPRTASNSGTGHGLMGMRERVALVGGEFSAGATPDGGFAVTATLPLLGAR